MKSRLSGMLRRNIRFRNFFRLRSCRCCCVKRCTMSCSCSHCFCFCCKRYFCADSGSCRYCNNSGSEFLKNCCNWSSHELFCRCFRFSFRYWNSDCSSRNRCLWRDSSFCRKSRCSANRISYCCMMAMNLFFRSRYPLQDSGGAANIRVRATMDQTTIRNSGSDTMEWASTSPNTMTMTGCRTSASMDPRTSTRHNNLPNTGCTSLFPNTMQDGANNCRTISHPNLYCTHRQESRIFSISIRSSHRLSGSMYCLYFRTH